LETNEIRILQVPNQPDMDLRWKTKEGYHNEIFEGRNLKAVSDLRLMSVNFDCKGVLQVVVSRTEL
jgi:hypothetical protein